MKKQTLWLILVLAVGASSFAAHKKPVYQEEGIRSGIDYQTVFDHQPFEADAEDAVDQTAAVVW